VQESHSIAASRTTTQSLAARVAVCVIAVASCVFAANPNAATQPSDLKPVGETTNRTFMKEWTLPINLAAGRMKETGLAIYLFQQKNEGRFPHDLGSLVSLFKGGAANCFQTPGDERRTKVPQAITADWVNANTSYVYLAADVDPAKLDPSINPAGTYVIAFHTKLDEPFKDTDRGDVIIATCLDGHSMILPVERARIEIASSEKLLAAARQTPAGGEKKP